MDLNHVLLNVSDALLECICECHLRSQLGEAEVQRCLLGRPRWKDTPLMDKKSCIDLISCSLVFNPRICSGGCHDRYFQLVLVCIIYLPWNSNSSSLKNGGFQYRNFLFDPRGGWENPPFSGGLGSTVLIQPTKATKASTVAAAKEAKAVAAAKEVWCIIEPWVSWRLLKDGIIWSHEACFFWYSLYNIIYSYILYIHTYSYWICVFVYNLKFWPCFPFNPQNIAPFFGWDPGCRSNWRG